MDKHDTHATHALSRPLCALACSLAAAAPTLAAAVTAPANELRIVSVEAAPQGAQVSIALARALALLPTDAWLEFPDGRRVDADLVTTRGDASSRFHLLRFRYPAAAGQRVDGVQLHVAPRPEDALVQTLATPIAALAPPPAAAVLALPIVPAAPPGVVAAASTSGDEPSNRMATYTADPAPAAASAVAEPAPPAHASAGGEDDTFSRWLAAGGVAALAAGVAVLLMRRHAGMGIDDRGGGFHPAPPPPPPLQAGAPPRAAEPEMPPGRRTRVGEYDFTPPAPRRPAALLQWRAGPRAGRAVGIEASRLTIGSDPSCDLALVDDDFVSGLHAEIRYEAGSLYLTDRESRNGTFLNGERMTALPRPLQRGDELRIGTTVLRLLDPSGTTPAVAGHDEGAVR